MKPASFDYVRPATVAEAVDALATPGAVVLAGGQSLLLELAYRDKRASVVIDVNDLAELTGLDEDADTLRIGALVRHRRFERDEGGGPLRRLLAKAAPYVAHPPIRTRGTFGGSVAWAHPAAEWNLVARLADAVVTLRSARATREVGPDDWYRGRCVTAAEPDELVTEVRLGAPPAAAGTGFAEHRRTHASFADVAAGVVVSARDGVVDFARVAVVGVGDIPVRAPDVEDALVGVELAAAPGRAEQATRLGRNHAGAVARALVGRAVAEAVGEL